MSLSLDQSYVAEDGSIVTGYDIGSPDGDYYCEMHYDKEAGIFTVLNFGRVLRADWPKK